MRYCIGNFLTLAFFTVALSCVSVGIDKPNVVRADGTSFDSPREPYKEFSADHVDAAWRNPKNGNSISYISDCNTTADPSYEAIRSGVVAGVRNMTIEESKMIDFNQRKALQSKITGSIDGVDTRFEILVLKKNNCIYVLTYVGLLETFNEDISTFHSFLSGFSAP